MGNRRRSRNLQLEQEQQATWERLQKQPWSPDGSIRAFGSGMRRIQLIELPSFSPASFWEVCELGSEWILYRAAVLQDVFYDPLQVQGYDQVAFSSDALRAFFHGLAALTLPLAPSPNNLAGIDGTTTRLTLWNDHQTRVQFEWWSEYPPSWAPLVHIAEEMLAAFKGQ